MFKLRMITYHESTPPNVRDIGAISNVVVGSRNSSDLNSAGKHRRIEESDDCHIIVVGLVNVFRVIDNLSDIVN